MVSTLTPVRRASWPMLIRDMNIPFVLLPSRE